MRDKYKHVNIHAIEIIEPYIKTDDNRKEICKNHAWDRINNEIENCRCSNLERAIVQPYMYKPIPWRELKKTLKFLNYSIKTDRGKKFTWLNYIDEDYLYIILK